MKNNLLNIVIPMYNMGKYINRCLDSICTQNLDEVCIYCVNDGSTDDSLYAVEQYKEKYSKHIVIINMKNQGRAKARNMALELITEGYVWFVDADDYISQDAIEILKDKLILQPDLIIFNRINLYKNHREKQKFGRTLETAGAGPGNKVIKRALINNYRYPEGFWYEDLGFIPIIIGVANKVVKIDDYFYYYDRSRQDSQTNSYDVDKVIDTIPMCDRVYEILTSYDTNQALHEQIKRLFIRHLIINTILVKFEHIRSKKARDKMVDAVSKEMDLRFPNWQRTTKKTNNLKQFLKVRAAMFYMHKLYLLGDLIWLVPRKIKKN
ncbi:glycosyltransferase family A protein [Pediococcus inopinatus]|uniref:glycosyltransferase family A protein n=1 Tax=Pediococcus inopinatus TaxID=114090 RepID=UPI0007C4F1A0|nr:glycosyltransferase family A protein [Pediococcus inopinatus]